MTLRIRKPMAVTGAVLLALALVWTVSLSHRWTQRVTPGWTSNVHYVGTQTWADSTGKIPDVDAVAEYERGMRTRAGDVDGDDHTVIIDDQMVIRDFRTDSITWEYVTHHPVDPHTGAHVTPAFDGDIVLFPRNVERRTYRLRTNYLKGVPLAFEGEEDMHGLKTYRFAYRGPVEYTESYLGSDRYPGIKIGPGQEVRCADGQFLYRNWIEPATGELVKLEEACPSGDHVYKTGTDSIITGVLRWTGVTSGEDLRRNVAEVRAQRVRYLTASIYLPLALAVAGIALLAAAIRPLRPDATGLAG